MASIGVTVSRLTGASDFAPWHGRHSRAGRFRSIPANLTHVLPLRLQLSEDSCLRDAVLAYGGEKWKEPIHTSSTRWKTYAMIWG